MAERLRAFICPTFRGEVPVGHRHSAIGVGRHDGELMIAITHPEFGTLAAVLNEDLCAKLADAMELAALPWAENDR